MRWRTAWLCCLSLATGWGCHREVTTSTPAFVTKTGQAGPAVEDRSDRVPPGRVVTVAMSQVAACYRLGDGRVACVGHNGAGALSQHGQRLEEVSLTERFSQDDIDLHLGDEHACALNRQGRVRCWGGAAFGRRGDGCGMTLEAGVVCDAGPPPKDPRAASVVGGLPKVAELAGGSDSTCVRTVGGEIWCWGAHMTGELGDANIDHATHPVRVALPPAAEIQAGTNHYCIVGEATREIWCWGSRHIDDQPNPTKRDVREPTRVIAAGVVEIGGRLDVTLQGACVVDEGNTARCWGMLAGGEHVPVLADEPIVLSDVVDVEGDRDYLCAVSVGGEVLCHASANLLLGRSEDEQAPVRGWQQVPMPFDGPAKRVFGSSWRVCALSEQGEVACWGLGASAVGVPDADEDTLLVPTLIGFDHISFDAIDEGRP